MGELVFKRIHVNMHRIRSNLRHNKNEPVVVVRHYSSEKVKTPRLTEYGHSVEISGPSKIIYSKDDPLKCGARVWIETDAEVIVHGDA